MLEVSFLLEDENMVVESNQPMTVSWIFKTRDEAREAAAMLLVKGCAVSHCPAIYGGWRVSAQFGGQQ